MKDGNWRCLGAIWLAGALLSSFSAGCVEQDNVFTQGRLEETCNGAIPVCDDRAACVLGDDEFFQGSFPGGQKVIVRSPEGNSKLVVRFLLEDMLSPGTELFIRVHDSDCGDFNERHPTDVDFFGEAGDDRILEYHIPISGRGDHLVEIFSDMGANYKMTTTVE